MENTGARPTSTPRFFNNEMSDLRNLMPKIFFLHVEQSIPHAKKYFGHQISQIRHLVVKKIFISVTVSLTGSQTAFGQALNTLG